MSACKQAENASTTNRPEGVDVEAFILAGGVSARMGRAKHLLDFEGAPLISRMVEIVQPLVKRLTVVGATEIDLAAQIRLIPDDDLGIPPEVGRSNGPLAGIATALAHSESEWNSILACDLPYLTREWLAWLLGRAMKSQAQVVMPATERGPEPLAAIYRRSCRESIMRSLEEGIRKVTVGGSRLDVETVHEVEWRDIDPDGVALKNMNTPSDYEEAQLWYAKQRHDSVGLHETSSQR
jgi:molybdopterin-guanine dinucleotide biosynthesis protein A